MSDIGVYSVLGALFVAWILFPFAFSVTGIWKREGDAEHIQFEQFGPIISGRRSVDGGNQMYSGFQFFIWLRVKRRDYGLPALIAQGFPEAIAKKVNGSIVARLTLRRAGKKRLVGSFTPMKIQFDEATVSVLGRHYEASQPRVFDLTNLSELPASKVEIKRSNLPPPAPQAKKKRNTF